MPLGKEMPKSWYMCTCISAVLGLLSLLAILGKSPCADTVKRWPSASQEHGFSRTWSGHQLDLELPASRTMRK